WLDGRNDSAFGGISWGSNTLAFTITVGAGARNLRAMLPAVVGTTQISSITRNGAPVPFSREVIKGIDYPFLAADPGDYLANYVVDTTFPCFTDDSVADFSLGATDAGSYVARIDDGDVILAPALATEFDGTALPAGWNSFPWQTGGSSGVANGRLNVD